MVADGISMTFSNSIFFKANCLMKKKFYSYSFFLLVSACGIIISSLVIIYISRRTKDTFLRIFLERCSKWGEN